MAQATRNRKASTKTVQVLARIEFKSDARKVVYKVRPSQGGEPYETTLFEGRATSCTCPSHKPCYHMTQLEGKEAAVRIAITQAEQVAAQVTQPRQDEYSDEERAEVNRYGGYKPLSREAYCQEFGIY